MDDLKKLLENAGINEGPGDWKDTSLEKGDDRGIEWPNSGWSKDDQRRWDGAQTILNSHLKPKLTEQEFRLLNAAVRDKGKMDGMERDYKVDQMLKNLLRFV